MNLFTPVLVNWAKRLGVPEVDQADLIQDTFVSVLQAIPQNRYDPNRSFRAWLFSILANRHRDHCRRHAVVPLGDLDPLDSAERVEEIAEEREYRVVLLQRILRLVRGDFSEATWSAFSATAIDGRTVEETARKLNMSPNSVYLARSRIMNRLRTELREFLD